MNDQNQARRASVAVRFAGVDITQSITPYLLSATYTDNEDGEADDLQFKLQDREALWLERWLRDAVDAAAFSSFFVKIVQRRYHYDKHP